MRRGKSTPWIAGAALIALLGGVAPVAALAGLCATDSECPMMSSFDSHCQPEVAMTSGDCCAEMKPAAEAPQLATVSALRQAAGPTPFRLPGSARIVLRSEICADSTASAVRGTPLYTLHLALLN